jgi:hypothetical protein
MSCKKWKKEQKEQKKLTIQLICGPVEVLFG